MVTCPYCGFKGEFKDLREPWKFRFYTVRMLECPKCHGVFNYYHGVSPRSRKASEFTIKVKPRRK